MKTLNITISKNFGKNISLELPNGSKHIITQSHNPGLYNDLATVIQKYDAAEKACSFDTFRMPDDYDFGDDDTIPLENIND